jgi:hypothetical protein
MIVIVLFCLPLLPLGSNDTCIFVDSPFAKIVFSGVTAVQPQDAFTLRMMRLSLPLLVIM